MPHQPAGWFAMTGTGRERRARPWAGRRPLRRGGRGDIPQSAAPTAPFRQGGQKGRGKTDCRGPRAALAMTRGADFVKRGLTVYSGNVILGLYKAQRENSGFFGKIAQFLLHRKNRITVGRRIRERPRGARSRRGMQKLSGKRIGSGRHFGKCGPLRAHTKGATGGRGGKRQKGISQVGTEAKSPQGSFCLFSFPC